MVTLQKSKWRSFWRKDPAEGKGERERERMGRIQVEPQLCRSPIKSLSFPVSSPGLRDHPPSLTLNNFSQPDGPVMPEAAIPAADKPRILAFPPTLWRTPGTTRIRRIRRTKKSAVDLRTLSRNELLPHV